MECYDAVCLDFACVSSGVLSDSFGDLLPATHRPGACRPGFVRRVRPPETYTQVSFLPEEPSRRLSPRKGSARRSSRVHSSRSEKNIEIDHRAPAVVSKEGAILRIGNVRVHLESIEVIGQVADCARKPHGVFRIYLNIFRDSHVEREIFWEAILRTIGQIHILLKYVGRLVGKTVAKLDMGRHRDLPGKSVSAPKQKSIGNFTGQTCRQAIAHNRERVVAQVGVGVADAAVGVLANVREEKLAIGKPSNPRRKLGLSSVRLAGVAEHERVLVLDHFRLKSDHILFVALKVFHAKQEKAIHGPFQGQIPCHAIGSEITALMCTVDKRKGRLRRLCGQVNVPNRRAHGHSKEIVGRDRLLGITAEGINIEWNGIVKDSDAAANYRFPLIGSPLETTAGSRAGGIGNRLCFDTQTGVNCQVGIEYPVILGKHSRLQIGKVEGSSSGKVDLLQKMVTGIFDLNRTSVEIADILAVAKHRPKLEDVLPGEVQYPRRPFFNPFKTIGTARFLAKVVAQVSDRREHHIVRPLCRYATTQYPAGDRALQQSAVDGQPIGERSSGLVEITVGGYWVRIEVIQSGILQRMWGKMEAAGQSLAGRENRVHLREGIERRRGTQTLVKGQCFDLLLVEQVFNAFQEIQVVGEYGTAHIESGSRVAYAIEVITTDEKVWKRIIETVIPLLTSTTRIRRNYARSEAPILCQVRHLRHFNGLDAVDWNA